MSAESGWLSPADLAQQMGMSERWVLDHMRSGEIPSVKIGNRRWFLPEMRAQLVAQPPPTGSNWARP